MGFFDDLQVRINQGSDVLKDRLNRDVNDYIENRLVDDVVAIGKPPTGNLSQADLDAGMRARTEPIRPSMASGMSENLMKILPFVLVGMVGFLLISKRRRG